MLKVWAIAKLIEQKSLFPLDRLIGITLYIWIFGCVEKRCSHVEFHNFKIENISRRRRASAGEIIFFFTKGSTSTQFCSQARFLNNGPDFQDVVYFFFIDFLVLPIKSCK